MADKKINIGISSTYDSKGTDAAAVGVNRVTSAEDALNAKRAQFLTAAEAEVAEVERMVAAAAKLSAAKNEEAAAIAAAAAAVTREQQIADVAEAKRRVQARTVTANAASMQNFGMVVNQVGFQVTDFAIQTQMGTSAITAFAQQAPQAIGAITQFGAGMKFSLNAAVGWGTAIGVIATAAAVSLQLGAREWDKMKASQDAAKTSAEDYKKALEFMNEQQKQLVQQTRLEFVTQNYREQAEFLERQVAALSRVNELRAAQGGAESAEAAAAVTIAQNTGGNVTGAKANQIAVGVNNQIDELASRVATAEGVTAQAAQALEQANAVAAEFRTRGDEFSDDSKAARAAVVKAEEALATAQADNEKVKAAAEFQTREIVANAEASISTLGTEVTAGIDGKVKGFVDSSIKEINAVVEARGGVIGESAASAMNKFQALINDQIPDSQQMDKITAAVTAFRNSQTTMLAGMVQNFDGLLTESKNLSATVASQKEELKRLREYVEQVTGT